MPQGRESTRQLIIKIIKRFKFGQLENAVMPVFPEISWSYVRSKLMKHHLPFNTPNAMGIIDKALIEAKVSERELEERLTTLKLIDISRNYKRKNWHTFVAKGSNSEVPNYLGNKEITDSIKRKLASISNKKTEVNAITFNGITYIWIQTDTQKPSPIVFAIFVGQRYFFCSRKTVPTIFKDTVTKVLGYNSSKKMNLIGRDLMSLMQMLRLKRQGALNAATIKKDPTYSEVQPVIKNTGIDYRQHAQRKEYADKYFGKNPPTLELLVVEAPKTTINDKETAFKLPDNIDIECEFFSKDLVSFIKKLVERQIFVPPLPRYVSEFMTIGKNVLTLQEE